jgi:dynamin 1-like protein
MAFENLIKQQILRLRNPSLECAGLVYEELKKLTKSINIPGIERFENLRAEIPKVMENFLLRCLIPTETMIKNLIEIELGYINTTHPDFVGCMSILKDNLNQSGDELEENKVNGREQNKKSY